MALLGISIQSMDLPKSSIYKRKNVSHLQACSRIAQFTAFSLKRQIPKTHICTEHVRF